MAERFDQQARTLSNGLFAAVYVAARDLLMARDWDMSPPTHYVRVLRDAVAAIEERGCTCEVLDANEGGGTDYRGCPVPGHDKTATDVPRSAPEPDRTRYEMADEMAAQFCQAQRAQGVFVTGDATRAFARALVDRPVAPSPHPVQPAAEMLVLAEEARTRADAVGSIYCDGPDCGEAMACPAGLGNVARRCADAIVALVNHSRYANWKTPTTFPFCDGCGGSVPCTKCELGRPAQLRDAVKTRLTAKEWGSLKRMRDRVDDMRAIIDAAERLDWLARGESGTP